MRPIGMHTIGAQELPLSLLDNAGDRRNVRTCLPVKPWQMTRVSLLIQTLAEADMARALLAMALTGAARTNIVVLLSNLCCELFRLVACAVVVSPLSSL